MKRRNKKPPRRLRERAGESNSVAATIGPPPSASKPDPKPNDIFLELGDDPIRHVSISEVRRSPENDQLYKPVRETDPEIEALRRSVAKSIQERTAA